MVLQMGYNLSVYRSARIYTVTVHLNNLNLKPEFTNEYQIGKHLRFFKDKKPGLYLFQKYKIQMSIIPLEISRQQTRGTIINSGKTSLCNGIEVMFKEDYSDKTTKAFYLGVGFNFSRIRSLVDRNLSQCR